MDFQAFPKMPRLRNVECVITEKIDGTNAQIAIDEQGNLQVGSRNRWLTEEHDNYGFYQWVQTHREALLRLGHGRHYGEWWGRGIQRGYDQQVKRLSLFDTNKAGAIQGELCGLLDTVPILYEGPFKDGIVESCLQMLRDTGSLAARGFLRPEGIVLRMKGLGTSFKILLENDETPKSMLKQPR